MEKETRIISGRPTLVGSTLVVSRPSKSIKIDLGEHGIPVVGWVPRTLLGILSALACIGCVIAALVSGSTNVWIAAGVAAVATVGSFRYGARHRMPEILIPGAKLDTSFMFHGSLGELEPFVRELGKARGAVGVILGRRLQFEIFSDDVEEVLELIEECWRDAKPYVDDEPPLEGVDFVFPESIRKDRAATARVRERLREAMGDRPAKVVAGS